MKNKRNILMYVTAILGVVLGVYLRTKYSLWGNIITVFCAMYIIGRILLSWNSTMAKLAKEKAIAKKELEEKRRLELEERKRKYNCTKNEMIARNGKPCKRIIFCESDDDPFNIDNELIVFDKTKRMWLCGTEISINDINSFTIEDETVIQKGQITAVTSTDTGSMMDRSFVGALLGGEAGAIIGGATAKKETVFRQEDDKITHNYALVVNIRDINNPMLLIKIGQDKDKAMEINALMQVIMTIR